MPYCQHLTRALTCRDPALPEEQRDIKCSWRGDCDRERPIEVMQQIAKEGIDSGAPHGAPTRSAARLHVQAARDRLASSLVVWRR